MVSVRGLLERTSTDPLHGWRVEKTVAHLVEQLGSEELAARIVGSVREEDGSCTPLSNSRTPLAATTEVRSQLELYTPPLRVIELQCPA